MSTCQATGCCLRVCWDAESCMRFMIYSISQSEGGIQEHTGPQESLTRAASSYHTGTDHSYLNSTPESSFHGEHSPFRVQVGERMSLYLPHEAPCMHPTCSLS